MPELPEVETVMRGMQIALQGRVIQTAIIRRYDLRWRISADFSQRISGRKVIGFRRRGKYILMRLAGDLSVILHLGMSGRIVLDSDKAPVPHEHVVLVTDDGKRCAFVDPRRFGMIDVLPTPMEDTYRLLAGMGPEPLDADFSSSTLENGLARKNASIKTVLLDQKIVAGLGNIYVCEALFRAGIHPETPAGTLKKKQIRLLHEAIQSVLTEAIAAGGSSLKDYVRPEGGLGYFQHAWKVYARKGQACPDCPGLPACEGVQHITQAGRSTFFCPRHQGKR
ncbi:bifunctional DNA-formamidopyrimidine glycosylase/DNA-(apurinic or apyrimidinic site) lyase [Acetobacter tropicalis]|uniref:Formamidopyrimidine-DNA glycosylase n=1 Tax=Acetobacter tropicalis NBRC 101654 TaxID=749388 RepID=F7VE98_9PROT|nr:MULTISPECIES: bifunctional DNA-formamidopyrimidine glycosylase/DNA-(apurinic or apyrimidinic site) lyase [Acetobacter]MCG4253132.1 bifunctional DNA-formamidopyrimidine glycosylase/DNA-(apurinic or apyrimidinic site) lyase [Acetobacter senegalensis]GAA08693.1 formamidopyrimidine-DNA glycosylase [Acetobacter tropicalis NBRC 101654]